MDPITIIAFVLGGGWMLLGGGKKKRKGVHANKPKVKATLLTVSKLAHAPGYGFVQSQYLATSSDPTRAIVPYGPVVISLPAEWEADVRFDGVTWDPQGQPAGPDFMFIPNGQSLSPFAELMIRHPYAAPGNLLGQVFVGFDLEAASGRIPPIEPPRPEGEGGAEGTSFGDPAAWGNLDFDVEIYPSGTKNYRNALAPPSSSAGITWSPGCDVIAVGSDWWERAGDYVAAALDAGNTVVTQIEQSIIDGEGLRACKATAPGFAALRAEMRERIADVIGNEGPLPVAPMPAIIDEEAIGPRFPLGPADQVTSHFKPGAGDHPIVLMQKSKFHPAAGQTIHYVDWFAWQPGKPMYLHTAFRKGSAENMPLALTQAEAAIDAYHLVQANPNRRGRGTIRRLVFW